jgi:hypothetical protein
MSRLIDADKLLEYGACPNDCNGTTACAEDYEHLHCPVRVFDIESINDTPTVKAIPKDKIKQVGEDIEKIPLQGINTGVIMQKDVLAILDRLISESEEK